MSNRVVKIVEEFDDEWVFYTREYNKYAIIRVIFESINENKSSS